jgi:hypothetical protein
MEAFIGRSLSTNFQHVDSLNFGRMYNFFLGVFFVLVGIAALCQYGSKENTDQGGAITEEFKRFQKNWLTVYYIVMSKTKSNFD